MLGSFEHKGAVWCIDANDECTRVVTASSANEAVLWNVRTGNRVLTYEQHAPVRFVEFAEGCDKFICSVDKFHNHTPKIVVYPISHDAMTNDDFVARHNTEEPLFEIPLSPMEKVNCVRWGPLNKTIIAAFDDGTIRCYDGETGEKMGEVKEHHSSINKFSFSKDKLLFITASVDSTAKLFETKTLEVIKTYKASQPLNTAAISPTRKHIILGGGTQAVDVTTTLARSGTFDIHFYHMVFEEEFGKVKGHFGPVHFVAFSPDGKKFVSGGEDGFVRLFTFDKDYHNFKDGPKDVY